MEHGEEGRGYDAREGKGAESKPKAGIFKGMARKDRCLMHLEVFQAASHTNLHIDANSSVRLHWADRAPALRTTSL